MSNINTKGLNGYQLKIIGLVFMVLDHIYQYFAFTRAIPIVFKWFGRLSAPIFIFLVLDGYLYTSSRKKYAMRLYIGHIFMNTVNSAIVKSFPRIDGFVINNNIFGLLLMMITYMYIVDVIRGSIKEKNNHKLIAGVLLLGVPIIFGILLNILEIDLLNILIPNVFTIEGGPMFLVLGVVMYITRSNIGHMMFYYLILPVGSIVDSLVNSGFNIKLLFTENYQWMMMFAILFFKLYNGKENNGKNGKGMKYLFYFFYPIHIYLLYMLSYFIMI